MSNSEKLIEQKLQEKMGVQNASIDVILKKCLPQQSIMMNRPILNTKQNSLKKKTVIHLISSEEQVQKQEENVINGSKKQTEYPIEKIKKIRKPNKKCQLCKSSGKKSEMKICYHCRLDFHLSCIEQQGKFCKKYCCEKCKFHRKQNKLPSYEQQKIIDKKQQKQRKHKEYLLILNTFENRYPYYFQNNKLKYPIQDKLIYIYKQIFDFTQNLHLQPKQHPLIPSILVGDFLQIENFYRTFQQELEFLSQLYQSLSKDQLYLSMNCEELDNTFIILVTSVIKLYLSDIFDKNKTDNVKILNQYSFFTLMSHLNQNVQLNKEFLISITPQIIRNLAIVPSMKKSFERLQFPSELNLHNKIKFLVSLIKGLSQIDAFHELVSKRSQDMQILTKQRTELISQLKCDEAQNLSCKEKQKQIKSANMNLELIDEQNKYTKEQYMQQQYKLNKERNKNKKQLQKIANDMIKSSNSIRRMKQRISQITKIRPFLTSQVIFLGKDRNNSLYYFHYREPNRIYVQYHQYLMDKNQNFYIYETKQKILELIKSLNMKGINEKQLADTIIKYIKDQLIVDINIIQQFSKNKLKMPKKILIDKQKQQQQQFKKNDLSLNRNNSSETEKIIQLQNKIHMLKINDISQLIIDLQIIYTNYLQIRNMQWSSFSYRENFMTNIKYIDNLQQMKENIKNLQQHFLFMQCKPNFQSLKKRKIQQDSDVEQIVTSNDKQQINKDCCQSSNKDNNFQNHHNYNNNNGNTYRKKYPVRLWGINAERIKKYWLEYLQYCSSIEGVWICVYILKLYIEKYTKKKIQLYLEQQRKEQKQDKERQRQRLRQIEQDQEEKLQRQYQAKETYYKEKERQRQRQRQRSKEIKKKKKHQKQIQQNEEQNHYQQIPKNCRRNLRSQQIKKNNVESAFNLIQSSEEQDIIAAHFDDSFQQSSSNEDNCQICGQYGSMICCDTCPKVFHLVCLKIKQIPEGEWSCFMCLEKLSNERQTRSRAKKINRNI